MFAHRSSGRIGSGGVKPTPKDQQPAIPQVVQVQQSEETVFRQPKEKRKKLKFQRE
jgi:hypothetical protein